MFIIALLSSAMAAERAYGPSLRPDVPFSEHVHRRFLLGDGLPSNWIYDIVQTQAGYVWIATHNGVARYDGLRFQVFNRSNTPQLPANDTRVLYERRDGSLWIGTIAGLVRYQPGRPGTFQQIETLRGTSVHAIYEDQTGKLWVGTHTETWVSVDGNDFKTAHGAPDDVRAICQDQHGVLWFGSRSGLYQLRDENAERIDHPLLPIPTEADIGVPPAGVNVLFSGEHGDIWIGANAGLLPVQDGLVGNRRREIGRSPIQDIIQTRDGGLYLATRYGVRRSVDGGEFVKLPSEELAKCIMEDREGGLWVGYAGGGLHYYRNAKTQTLLNELRVNCVYEDSGGNMWFGSNSGLHRLSDGQIAHYGIQDGLPDATVHTIARCSNGGFWIGARQGLAKWSGTEFSAVLAPSDLARLNISSAFEDSAGTLWLALRSRGGYTLKDGELEELSPLEHGGIRWFREDSGGNLWIGHEYGLYRHRDGQMTQVTDPAFERLNSPHFTCYYAAKDGTLWMGNSGGIVRYRSGRFNAVTSEEGLAADYVDRMVADNHGNLWFGGRDGFFYVSLAELNQVADGKLENVTSHFVESIKSVPVITSHPKGCLATDGTMWAGGHRGVIRVSPEPWADPVSPPMHIERVRVDGNTVAADEHCEFMSGTRRLAIDFAAPTYADPRNVRLRYRLDGHDKGWIDAVNERIAYYTDLRPGKYTFRVTAQNGVALPAEETLDVMVRPQWWETATFRTLAAICLVALTICSTWGYTRAVRRRNAVLRHEIDQRKRVEADRRQAEAKARNYLRQLERINRASSMGEMATSIAHEVNQPLFAIVSNAEMAKEFLDSPQPDIEEVRDALSDIIGDGNRAAKIIKHIRSLVNKEQPITERLDLNRVVQDSLEIIRSEMRQRGVSIRTEFADELPPVKGSAIELQQVILNLVINGAQAMRETNEGPHELQLTTSTDKDFVELSVKDYGVGFDQETVDRLFDPFFTTKPQGIGMGLAINRTIIEAHGGKIWATSNEDCGATFHFRLPAVTESTT